MRALWRLGAVSLPCPGAADRRRRRRADGALGGRPGAARAGRPAAGRRGHHRRPSRATTRRPSSCSPRARRAGRRAPLHRRGYAAANRLQAERWMGVRPGDRVWCTAATGWSKSLRNSWLAAELMDAEAVFHAGRFDAAERLELIPADRTGRPLHVAHGVPPLRRRAGVRARRSVQRARGGGRRRGAGRRHGRALARGARARRARRLRADRDRRDRGRVRRRAAAAGVDRAAAARRRRAGGQRRAVRRRSDAAHAVHRLPGRRRGHRPLAPRRALAHRRPRPPGRRGPPLVRGPARTT